MYSDLIDSVKNTKSNEATFIKAEAFLFQSLLNGNKPTLTLSQAMDSAVILSIAQNSEQSSYFIKAIENGYIRISLYGQADSLQGYLLKTLKRNTDINSSKFIFSNMPFLYNGNYTEKQQISIYSALVKQIEEGNPKNNNLLLDKDSKAYLEEYVETITKINTAARNAYIPSNVVVKQLKDVIKLRVNERLKTIVENESLKALFMFINKNCTSNYRTFYYDIINKKSEYYEPAAIQEVKELIDYCYNEVVASSINDNEPANLNIPNIFPELAASTREFSNIEKLSKNEITISEPNKEYLTWERMLIVMKEIESIQDKKKCNWNEALETYALNQRLLPFTLGIKYSGITALTLAISSVPILGNLISNFAAELLWSSVSDAFGETMKKPSFSEIVKVSKESEKRCRLLNMAVSNTSLNINANSLNRK